MIRHVLPRPMLARLARETPAIFIAFDLLALGDRELLLDPLAARRAKLESVLAAPAAAVSLTPATHDPDGAKEWLDGYEGGGIDGVVAKALDGAYLPGKRGRVKVKRQHTADCVVAGLRLLVGGDSVGSLLRGHP